MKPPERIHVSDPADKQLSQAAKRIEAGELVAFPTETVYGIACRASAETLKQLDEVKGRTPDKHYTLHIGDVHQLEGFLALLSPTAAKLTKKALPGPLTLVYELTPSVQDYVKAWLGQEAYGVLCRDNTLGIRCPDHPVAQALLSQTACPVVAPSANKTGQVPASNADEVINQMAGSISLVLDAGPCALKQSSTVVKIGQTGKLDLLREGLISQQAIFDMARIQFLFVCTGNTCRSPMAEGIARQILTQHLSCKEIDDLSVLGYKILSAGTMGMSGMPASEGAIAACVDRGIDISSHKSNVLSASLVQKSDFIFTMTRFHLETVLACFPEASDRCTRLDSDADIGDPVGQPVAVYRACATQIENAIENRLSELAI
ncbi:MAG: threonylcarbamoyl-AMP synthase [Phycisphaeraceae bacterium]|nr:threonylcarbamoyl-AMP synthase [Phycisphaeraceae bacterium]